MEHSFSQNGEDWIRLKLVFRTCNGVRRQNDETKNSDEELTIGRFWVFFRFYHHGRLRTTTGTPKANANTYTKHANTYTKHAFARSNDQRHPDRTETARHSGVRCARTWQGLLLSCSSY